MLRSALARDCPNSSSNVYGGTSFNQSAWRTHTMTSRNAGSKVPLNERNSLYRYETETYFSGFPKRSAVAWYIKTIDLG